MAYMPISIIFDILVRLPVKSLVRFKALNKLCCSIIMDPHFINSHFKNSTANKAAANHCLIISCMEHRDLNTTVIHFLTLGVGVGDEHDATVEYSAHVSFDSYQVLPSCNGLACFYGLHGGGVHVCNPSTKDIVKLPDSDDAQDFRTLSCGFGFDETSGTYKVIKFLEPQRIEIFSMGKIRYCCDYPTCLAYLHHQPPVFCKGYFYWFSSASSIIVSFDIGNEIFEPVSPPQSTILDKDLCKLYLVELRGELCLVDLDYELDQERKRMDIWVYKRKDCWEQLGTIIHESEPIDSVRPVGLKCNDEILLHGFINGVAGPLCCYNLEGGGFRSLQVEGIPSCRTLILSGLS